MLWNAKQINWTIFFSIAYSESWEEAACREVCEETGIHITDIKFCHVVNSIVPDIDYHYVTIFMKGEISCCGNSEPKNMEPDKCEGNTIFRLIIFQKFYYRLINLYLSIY